MKRPNPLYYTTIGSLITTVRQITGKTEEEAKEYFNMLNKHKNILENKTFKDIAEYVFTTFGNEEVEELWKQSLAIVYDNVRAPLFVLFNEEGYPMPLKDDGTFTGVLYELSKSEEEMKVQVNIEFIFSGEENQ